MFCLLLQLNFYLQNQKSETNPSLKRQNTMPTSVVPPSPAKRNRSSMSTQANLPSKSPSINTSPDVVPTASKKKKMVRFNLKSQPKMTAGNKEVATTAKKASAKKSSARAPQKIVRRVATPATKKTLTKQMKVASKNSPPKTKSISSIAPGNKSKSKKKISRRKVKLTISPIKIVISPPKISPSKKSEREDDSVKTPSDNEYMDDEEDDHGTANLKTQPTESHNTTSKTFLSYFNQKPDKKYATKIQKIDGVLNHKDIKMLKRQMKDTDTDLVHFAFLVRYSNEALQYLDKLQQDNEAGNPEHPDFSRLPSPMAKHIENFYNCVTNVKTTKPVAKDMFLSLNKLISIISNTQKVLDLCMDLYSEDIPSASESRVILADVNKNMREKTETSKKSVTGPKKLFHEGASKSPNSETGEVEVEVEVAIDVQPLENEDEMQKNGYEKIYVSLFENSKFDKCKTDSNHDAFVKLDKFCDDSKIHFGKVCEQFKRASDEDVGNVALYLSEMDSFANANELPDLFFKLSKEFKIIRNHPDKETRTEILKLLVEQRNKVRYVQTNGQKYLNTLIIASKVQILLDQMCPSDCTPFIHDEASEFHLLTCEELKFKYDGLWILKKATGNCNLLGTVSEMSRAELHLLSEGFNDLLGRKRVVKKFPSNYLPHSAFDVLAKEEVFTLYKYLKKIQKDFGREEAFSDCEAVMNAFFFHRAVLDSYNFPDNIITLSKKIGHEKNTGVFDDEEDEEMQENDQPAMTIEEFYRRQEQEDLDQKTADMWSKFRGSYEDVGLDKPVQLGEGVSPVVTDEEDDTGGQQHSPSASIAGNQPVVEEMRVDEPEGTNVRDVAEVAGGQPHSPSASIAENEQVVEEMQVDEPEGTNVRDVAEVAGGQPHSPSALIVGEEQGSNVLQVGTGVTVVSDASLVPQLSPDASIQDPKPLHSTPLEKDAISRRKQPICDAGNLTPIPAPQPTGEERQDDQNDGHCSNFEESYVNFLRKNYGPQNSQQSDNEEASSERAGTVISLL